MGTPRHIYIAIVTWRTALRTFSMLADITWLDLQTLSIIVSVLKIEAGSFCGGQDASVSCQMACDIGLLASKPKIPCAGETLARAMPKDKPQCSEVKGWPSFSDKVVMVVELHASLVA